MSKTKYKKFIIGKDSKGKIIEFTCDQTKLANNFGANSDASHFLTHVFFKKEVLDKYYNKPSDYSINDGYLVYTNEEGVNIWGIPIDNNAQENIMVYLGDLEKIPYEEQEYWRLYNIESGESSLTSYNRDFRAEFCSPEEPVLYFKQKLKTFNKNWKNKFGWELFRPLNSGDEHHLKSLKIPSKEQKEFDEKVLSITKIIIDSLNEPKLKESLTYSKGDKSIEILSKYLEQKHKFKSPEMIQYFRNLQELRSKCSAHRKGSDFQETYKKFDKGDFSKTFKEIVIGAITLLNTLESNILKEMKK